MPPGSSTNDPERPVDYRGWKIQSVLPILPILLTRSFLDFFSDLFHAFSGFLHSGIGGVFDFFPGGSSGSGSFIKRFFGASGGVSAGVIGFVGGR